jgi:hypothetical protein
MVIRVSARFCGISEKFRCAGGVIDTIG